jgi:HK97 family phage major capsid protein
MDLQELLEQINAKVGDDEPATAKDADTEREGSSFVGSDADTAAVIKAVAEGHLAVGRGVPGASTAVTGKGWKSGTWGEPVEKAVNGQLKGLTSGVVTVPALSQGIVGMGDRALRILDLIPTQGLDGTDAFAWIRETKREHKAAETAQSTLKPTSKYGVKLEEDKAVTIAHLSEPIANQILSDTVLLRGYIDDAMRQGVLLRLDQQILLGNGTGENLLGIGNDPDRHEVEWTEDVLKTTRKAVGVLEDEELTGAFVLAPSVWEDLELITTANGDSILTGPPVDRANKRLWGAPVVTTIALSGTPERGFYVDFEGSTELRERETVNVSWSDAPEGSVAGEAAFNTNEVIFRGEGRYGLARKRPRGFVEFEAVEP